MRTRRRRTTAVKEVTRVWRLDIIYPEGSREPGWHPACWDDPGYLASLPRRLRKTLRRWKRAGFRWPREREFLSSSAAYDRAALLRAWGADVLVQRSDPVTWPDPVRAGEYWQDAAMHSPPVWLAPLIDASGLPLTLEDPGLAALACPDQA